MSKHRVSFEITVKGVMDLDLDEDGCPLHDFGALSTSELLDYLVWACRRDGLVEPHEIEEMEAECLDPPLIQLARQAL